jgi:hypothetical protein
VTTRADDNSDDTTAVRAPDYLDTDYLFSQVKAHDPELLISGSGVRNPAQNRWSGIVCLAVGVCRHTRLGFEPPENPPHALHAAEARRHSKRRVTVICRTPTVAPADVATVADRKISGW